jgi:dihydroorotate dehydrogenase electron transfer subunit
MSEPRTLAPFGRRRLGVAERRAVGAYVVLAAEDPDGPLPRAGQFYMLAAEREWGGGEDERPFLPRAFSVLRAREGAPVDTRAREGVPGETPAREGAPVDTPAREGAPGDTPARQSAPGETPAREGAPGEKRAAERRLEFMLEAVGPGTERLCELTPGDGLYVTGPLGIGFPDPPSGRRALLCGGGVGAAPLAIWQDELLARGEPAPALLGFRDAAHAPGATLLHNARVATDDGSHGHHGVVTDLLALELDADDGVIVYACGPPPMLEAVRAMCASRGVPSRLALESGMACGFGACFGCVVALRSGGYLRLCVEGPVLDGELLAEVPAHAPTAAPQGVHTLDEGPSCA